MGNSVTFPAAGGAGAEAASASLLPLTPATIDAQLCAPGTFAVVFPDLAADSTENVEYYLSPMDRNAMVHLNRQIQQRLDGGIVMAPDVLGRHFVRLLRVGVPEAPSFAIQVARRTKLMWAAIDASAGGATGDGASSVSSIRLPRLTSMRTPREVPTPLGPLEDIKHALQTNPEAANRMLQDFQDALKVSAPLSLYSCWAPWPAVPAAAYRETAAAWLPDTAVASSSQSEQTRAAAPVSRSPSPWCAESHRPESYWQCGWDRPINPSQIQISWFRNQAPAQIVVLTSMDGRQWTEQAQSLLENRLVANLPLIGVTAQHIRIIMKGYHPSNNNNAVAIQRVVLFECVASALVNPVLDALTSSARDLFALAQNPTTRFTALWALAFLALNTGSLTALLTLVDGLLLVNSGATEPLPRPFIITPVLQNLVGFIKTYRFVHEVGATFHPLYSTGGPLTDRNTAITRSSQAGEAFLNIPCVAEYGDTYEIEFGVNSFLNITGVSVGVSRGCKGGQPSWTVPLSGGMVNSPDGSHNVLPAVDRMASNVVTLIVNMADHTLSYVLNGRLLGTVFRNLPDSVFPFVTFVAGNQVQISLRRFGIRAFVSEVPAPPPSAPAPPTPVAAGNPSPSPLPVAPPPPPPAVTPRTVVPPPIPISIPAKWQCGVCTFENDSGVHTCEMCGTDRPPGSAVPTPTPVGSRPLLTEWSCEQCTFSNSISDAKCSICNAPIPPQVGQRILEERMQSMVSSGGVPFADATPAPAPAPAPAAAAQADIVPVGMATASAPTFGHLPIPGTQFGVAIELLTNIANEAEMRSTHIRTSTASMPLSFGPLLDANMPLLLEASRPCFLILSNVIKRLLSHVLDSGVVDLLPALKAALRIMQLHFDRIKDAKMDPALAAISDVLRSLLEYVQALPIHKVQALPADVQTPLVQILVACMSAAVPAADSLRSVFDSISRQHTTPAPPGTLQYRVLALTLMERAEDIADSLTYTGDMPSAVPFYASLCNIAGADALMWMRTASTAADTQSYNHTVSAGAAAVARAIQRRIWAAAMSGATPMLVAWRVSSTLLTTTCGILRAAISCVQSANSATLATVSNCVEGVLAQSLVVIAVPSILALLGKPLAKFSSIAAILPHLVVLTRHMSAVNAMLPSVVTAEHSVVSEAASVALSEAGNDDVADKLQARAMVLNSFSTHPLLDVQKFAASVAASLACMLISAAPESEEEELLASWLKSECFSAGGDRFAVDPDAMDRLPPQLKSCVQALQADDDAVMIPKWTEAVASARNDAIGVTSPVPVAAVSVDVDVDDGCAAFMEKILPAAQIGKVPKLSDEGALVYGWLDTHVKKALGTQSFKLQEMAIVAAAIKHTGLWPEVAAALQQLQAGKPPRELSPSPELRGLFIRVRSFNAMLVTEKNNYEVEPVEIPREYRLNADGEEEGAVEGKATDVAPSDSKEDTAGAAAGGAAAGGSAAPVAGSATRMPRRQGRKRIPVDYPTTYKRATAAAHARARFLLELAPACTAPVMSSGSSLPPAVAPLLMRWSSSADGGDVDAEESIAVLRPDAALDAFEAPAPEPSPVLATTAACANYILSGLTAHPYLLTALLQRRAARASQRAFGLHAIQELVDNITFSSVQIDVVSQLRAALRGRVRFQEQLTGDRAPNQSDLMAVRHHYFKSLEGVSSTHAAAVHVAFVSLYSSLGRLLRTAAQDSDQPLAHALMWNWSLDFQPRDFEFLLRSGVFPMLQRLRSVWCALEAPIPTGWQPLNADKLFVDVQLGLITPARLVAHMQSAVPSLITEDWLVARRMHGDPEIVAAMNALPVIWDAYQEVVRLSATASAQPSPMSSSRTAAMWKGVWSSTAVIPAIPQAKVGMSPEQSELLLNAVRLFQHIATRVLTNGGTVVAEEVSDEDGSPAPTPSIPGTNTKLARKLYSVVATIIEQELFFAADYFEELRRMDRSDARFGQGPTHITSLHLVEDVAYDNVAFLWAMSTTQPMMQRLAHNHFGQLPALAQLCHTASPRVQSVICNLFGTVLPRLPLDVLASAGIDGSVAAEHFVHRLMKRIADSCAASAPPAGSKMGRTVAHDTLHPKPLVGGIGYSLLCAAADAVCLMRNLIAAAEPRWRDLCISALLTALGTAHSVLITSGDELTVDDSLKEVFAGASAALCVLGGATEVLRCGGSVSLQRSESAGAAGGQSLMQMFGAKADGTVIWYQPGNSKATVCFQGSGAGDAEVQEVAVKDLVPVAKIRVPFDCVPPTESLLAVFTTFINLPVDVPDSSEHKAAEASGASPVRLLALWKAEIKFRAVCSLLQLVQNGPTLQAVLSSGLMSQLLRASLVPVKLQTFVAYDMVRRWSVTLHEMTLDASAGVTFGEEGGQSGGGTSRRDSEARQLKIMFPEYDIKLCIKALQLNNDAMDRAAEWLLNGHGDAFLRGGGMDADVAQDVTPRWVDAKDLGLVVGLPPKLCYHALELNGDDRNRATYWLMDNGQKYVALMRTFDDNDATPVVADTNRNKMVQDEAVLEELGDAEALVCESSSATGREEAEANAVMVAAAGAAAEEPEQRSGPTEALLQRVNAGAGTAPGAGLQGGTLLLYTRSAGSVEMLCVVGRVVTMVGGSASGNNVRVRYLEHRRQFVQEATLSLDELRLISSLHSKRLNGPAVLWTLSAAMNLALATYSARRLVCSLLMLWPASVPLSLRNLGGAAQFVNLVKMIAASEHVFDAPTASGPAAASAIPGETTSEMDGATEGKADADDDAASAGSATPRSTASGSVAGAGAAAAAAAVGSPSADAAAGSTSTASSSSVLMNVLREKLQWLLQHDNDPVPGGSTAAGGAGGGGGSNWACPVCTFVNEARVDSCAMCAGPRPAVSAWEAANSVGMDAKLAKVLVSDCVWNIMQATQSGDSTEAITNESLHPYFPQCAYSGEVHFDGAKALMVKFDPRCTTGPAAQLSFFSDKAHNNALQRFQGGAGAFQPFVVHSDRLYFEFRSRSDSDPQLWGYRFHVSPVRGLQWLSEQQVSSEPSLEWACWLLDFLLNEVGNLLNKGDVHNAQVFDALVSVIRTPGSPYKDRIIALLTQLLKTPYLFPGDSPPQWSALSNISELVMRECERRRAAGSLFLPSRLQQLVELVTVARAARRSIETAIPAPRPFDPTTAYVRTGLLLRETKLAVPVEKEVLPDPAAMSVQDILVDLMMLAECLVVRARLPDAVVCGAWLMANSYSPQDLGKLDSRKLTDSVGLLAGCTMQFDKELVEYAHEAAAKVPQAVADLRPGALPMVARDNMNYPTLLGSKESTLRLRFAVIRHFNLLLARCIEMIDTSQAHRRWSLGYMMRLLNHITFTDTKSRLVEAAVEATWLPPPSNLAVTLDNNAAFSSLENNRVAPSNSQCIFVQTFAQLQGAPARQFRCQLDEKGRLYRVSFRNEDGVDWGGLFRDALARAVEDVFSSSFNLCIPCPNAVGERGMNTEKYLPNPVHTTPRCIEMFEFLGKLMGISMRLKSYLSFDFPSLIWKSLVGQSLTWQDLHDVDELTADSIRRIQNCEASGITTQDAFATAFPDLFFTVPGSNGESVDLLPNGSRTPLTLENKNQWAKLALQYRLHEFDLHTAAIRRGLITIIPERAVKLCTWQSLELYVCGDPTIDIDVLEANTTYHGYSKGDKPCRYLFSVLRSMSNKERSNFIRFAWGRSRLPKPAQWDKPFKLTKKNGGDALLPLAHTCFFQIELPPYSSEAITRARILAACNYGLGAFLIA